MILILLTTGVKYLTKIHNVMDDSTEQNLMNAYIRLCK